MPHIFIEYTPNLGSLPFDLMLADVMDRLAASPEVEDEADLKRRVFCADAFRIGIAPESRGFIHVTVRILEGRSVEAKKDFSDRVTEGMLMRMPSFTAGFTVHLSVEVVDMDRGSYRKVRLVDARAVCDDGWLK